MGKQKLTMVLVLMFVAHVGWGSSRQPHSLTLLVIPERYNLVQASFDVMTKRPMAVVAYRVEDPGQQLVLHAWANHEWIPVPLNDYADGSFLLQQPSRIVLVGPGDLVPAQLMNGSQWGPMVLSIPSVETADLLNDLGRLLEFNSAEWSWFASRYHMDLDNLAARVERESWYDQKTRARQRAPRGESARARRAASVEGPPPVLRRPLPAPAVREPAGSSPVMPSSSIPPARIIEQQAVVVEEVAVPEAVPSVEDVVESPAVDAVAETVEDVASDAADVLDEAVEAVEEAVTAEPDVDIYTK